MTDSMTIARKVEELAADAARRTARRPPGFDEASYARGFADAMARTLGVAGDMLDAVRAQSETERSVAYTEGVAAASNPALLLLAALHELGAPKP